MMAGHLDGRSRRRVTDMSVNIGIFDKEADVVEAIRLLREAGMDHDEMRVIVKNAETASLIASATDVPVEELAGVQGAETDDGLPDAGFAGRLPVLIAAPGNNQVGGTTSYGSGVAAAAGLFGLDGEDGHNDRWLRDIGIPGHASERCGEEVDAGRILLFAETDEDTNTDSILRHAGAADVLH
jgi:hypothetical protein